MPVVLDHLLAELDGLTEGPYVIFGHSLGGCIAYELALRIQATQQRRPLVLGISATRAPASPMGAPTYNLPDDAFLAGIQGFGGTPKAVVADRELLMWALPRLRADTELNERAPLTRDGCLGMPIVCFHGTEDPVCDRRECEKWSAHTTGGFEAHGFQGGHFYLRDHQRAIIEVLLRDRSVASVHPPRAADGSR
jgi:surfactin synthase thioesterase subunit